MRLTDEQLIGLYKLTENPAVDWVSICHYKCGPHVAIRCTGKIEPVMELVNEILPMQVEKTTYKGQYCNAGYDFFIYEGGAE